MFYVHDDIVDLIENERINFLSTVEGLPFIIDKQVGPGSVDLRLGLSFRKFKTDFEKFDFNTSDDTELITLLPNENISIGPNEIVLANTLERVFLSSNIGAILTGRSSFSRMGLLINISQDFIQPGYVNTIPLQLVNLHKDKTIVIPATVAICQLILINASSNTSIPYSIDPNSKYAGESSETEPSKLGIELGLNVNRDFKSKTPTSIQGKYLIEKWNKKLKAEASASKGQRTYKNDESEIGVFIKRFIGKPNISDYGGRTTLRDDSIYKAIEHFLSNGATSIRLLDVCCGTAGWISFLESSIGEKISKIEFVGVDGDDECIRKLNASQYKDKFSRFNSLVRKANDLEGLSGPNGFDIIIFSNSLHEIGPDEYSIIFESMNNQVNETKGKIIITDMEELPDKEIESIAINWTGEEVVDFLKSAGFTPSLTRHQKEVPVFQVTIGFTRNFNRNGMLIRLRELLIQKRLSNIELLEHMETVPEATTLYRIQWLKQICLIAQISKSIKRINELIN
ncbi:MAG: dCTP deaminase [Saprospiraceae bacterium]